MKIQFEIAEGSAKIVMALIVWGEVYRYGRYQL